MLEGLSTHPNCLKIDETTHPEAYEKPTLFSSQNERSGW